MFPGPNASKLDERSPLRLFVCGVYYPNWKVYDGKTPNTLNTDCISHVFYAFAGINEDGTLKFTDEQIDVHRQIDGHQGALRALAGLRSRAKGLQLLLSIGGGSANSDSFKTIAFNQQKREVFARSCRQMVDEYKFNGIDIDWEHPSNEEEGQAYISLLRILRRHLPRPTYLLTSALPCGEWVLKHIDLPSAADLLDFINLMAYDLFGQWSDATGHHSQLYFSDSAPPEGQNSAARGIAYINEQGVDLKKIILGIPAYGRSFKGANNIGQAFKGVGGEEGTYEYKDLPLSGTEEITDTAVGAAYCAKDDEFVTYDNPETVKMKAYYVRHYGLGGIFFWTGTSDGVGPRSLLVTAYEYLHDMKH